MKAKVLGRKSASTYVRQRDSKELLLCVCTRVWKLECLAICLNTIGCSLFICERTKGVFQVWVCVRVSSSHCCNLHSYSENFILSPPMDVGILLNHVNYLCSYFLSLSSLTLC